MALYGDNPTDPKKTVTRGKTTTTTSTREGSVRGRTGTFTDVKETTPVNTAISDNNSGSEEFNSAFANARKQGLSNFDFKGKKYNTDMGSNTTSNETSTTTTFAPHKETGVAPLNPSGIRFVPQSYKMGKTQTIQEPGADAMHVISVGRGNPKDGGTRDLYSVTANKDGTGYFMGKPIPQGDRVVTLNQKRQLQKNVDNYNSILNKKYSPENITANLKGQPQAVINKAIAKGKDRINKNKAFYKVPK